MDRPENMMKGRIRITPGFSNKLLALAPRFLPRNLVHQDFGEFRKA